MQVLVDFFAVILEGFRMPFAIYGFSFSFFDLLLFSVVVSIVTHFIGRLMDLFA